MVEGAWVEPSGRVGTEIAFGGEGVDPVGRGGVIGFVGVGVEREDLNLILVPVPVCSRSIESAGISTMLRNLGQKKP